jgi:hypothetical protein
MTHEFPDLKKIISTKHISYKKDQIIENWDGIISYLTASMLLIVSEFNINTYEEGLKIGKVIGNISESNLRNLMNIFSDDKKMGPLKELFTNNHKKLIKFIELFCLGKSDEYIAQLNDENDANKEERSKSNTKSPAKTLQNVVLIVLTIVLELSLLGKSDKPLDKLMEGEHKHLENDAHEITELALALSEKLRGGKEAELYGDEFFHEAVEVITNNISISAKKRAKYILKIKAHVISTPAINVPKTVPSMDKILKAAEINLHKLVIPGFENNDAKVKNLARQIGRGISK